MGSQLLVPFCERQLVLGVKALIHKAALPQKDNFVAGSVHVDKEILGCAPQTYWLYDRAELLQHLPADRVPAAFAKFYAAARGGGPGDARAAFESKR